MKKFVDTTLRLSFPQQRSDYGSDEGEMASHMHTHTTIGSLDISSGIRIERGTVSHSRLLHLDFKMHSSGERKRPLQSDENKCDPARKLLKQKRLKANSVIEVPAVSSRIADIPADQYKWRKYGQKQIKGTPHPRCYYKCNIGNGCPARKHIEHSMHDSNMLVVAYKGEHHHVEEEEVATNGQTI